MIVALLNDCRNEESGSPYNISTLAVRGTRTGDQLGIRETLLRELNETFLSRAVGPCSISYTHRKCRRDHVTSNLNEASDQGNKYYWRSPWHRNIMQCYISGECDFCPENAAFVNDW